jgi:hypothetical protein
MIFAESHQPGNNRYMNKVQELTGWATPTAHERTFSPRQVAHGIQLANQAQLAGWMTPQAADTGSSRTPRPKKKDHPRDMTKPGSYRADLKDQVVGVITKSSPAETANRVVLAAEFSRWLMGYPATWDEVSPNYEAWRSVQDRIVSGV